jgi:hypothetical protein
VLPLLCLLALTLGVAIRDVCILALQGRDHVSEGTQRLVAARTETEESKQTEKKRGSR